ncbi:MAG: hypothetical protein WCB31_02390 [Nitrososphaeraceae archaeon]
MTAWLSKDHLQISNKMYIDKQKKRMKHNLSLDKAYHSKEVEQELSNDDTYHIYRIEEKKRN